MTRLVLVSATMLAFVWTAGTALAPWLAAHDSIAGAWLRLVYRPGCHQMADRCLDFGFGPLAVCARCFGLYAGGTAGLAWTAFRNRTGRPHPGWLVAFAIPTAVDWLLGVTGIAASGSWLRFALGAPLGFIVALYLSDALIEIVRKNLGRGAEPPAPDSVG
jgi:uncharacterized membrane protein